jgi:branched-chain amino acid transport system permease protein
MSMLMTLVQYVVDGLMVGLTYALVAMGLTMIFGMMQIINFAHGELYMLGGLIAYYATAKAGLGFFPSFLISVAVAFAFGWVLDRLVMKRIRNAPHLMSAAVTIGLAMFLSNSANIMMGPVPQAIPVPFELKPVFVGPIILTRTRLFAGAVTLAVIFFTNWMIRRTSLGRAMRATIQDHLAAQLVGINTDRIFAFTFAYGSALAAVAGVLLGALFVVTPYMGESMIMKAWTVVIVGGLGNVTGAIFAGLIVAVAESLAAAVWTSSWANVVAFIIVIIVLLFRPQGLFGRA